MAKLKNDVIFKRVKKKTLETLADLGKELVDEYGGDKMFWIVAGIAEGIVDFLCGMAMQFVKDEKSRREFIRTGIKRLKKIYKKMEAKYEK